MRSKSRVLPASGLPHGAGSDGHSLSDGLRILDINDAFTAATGWRGEEVVGRPEAEARVLGSRRHAR
jgi:PAS domain-containing protein